MTGAPADPFALAELVAGVLEKIGVRYVIGAEIDRCRRPFIMYRPRAFDLRSMSIILEGLGRRLDPRCSPSR